MAAIAGGVSTRRYASTQEPVPEAHKPSAASKSAVSRRFVQLSQEQLAHWLARSIGQLDLPVVMIDGIHFRDRVILLAIGIDAQGNKHVLGLREGSTEAARVVASLLSDLIDRGLDAQRMRLWVIDGGKALRKAIVQTFGACALIQRCQEHKRRNVLEHLPEDMHAGVKRALRHAWSASHADQARRPRQRLASSLQARHPGAAASLQEGLEDGNEYTLKECSERMGINKETARLLQHACLKKCGSKALRIFLLANGVFQKILQMAIFTWLLMRHHLLAESV